VFTAGSYAVVAAELPLVDENSERGVALLATVCVGAVC
jgi:hypothetical protein